MDRRPIRQIFAQIMTEFFLCAAANRDDHLCGATLLNQRNKIWIGNFESIARRDITILAGNRKRFPPRPIQQFLPGASGGNDPKNFSSSSAFQRARADVSNTSGPKCAEGFHDETNATAEPSNHCRQSPDQPRGPRADTARPRAIGQNKFPKAQSKTRRAGSLTGPLHRRRR